MGRVGIKERSATIIIFRVSINARSDKVVKFVNISTEVKLVATEDIANSHRSATIDKKVSDIRGRTDKEGSLTETVFSINFSATIEEK